MAEPPESWDQRIPLGGLGSHAVRRQRWRRRLPGWPLLAAGAGLAAALAGVLLASSEPEVRVGFDAAGYQVAGERLTDRGGGAYVGPSGAALVIARSGGGSVAAASTNLDGRHMTGRCEVAPPPGGETCRFTLGGESLTASDERTSYGWHRRYSDGRTVAIHVAGDREAPVPFALGR
jgi:hypothetical protein